VADPYKGMPPIVMHIPDTVPEDYVRTDPDGTQRKDNGRTMYTAAYESGWKEFWERYSQGEFRADDPKAEPKWSYQDYWLSVGYRDGFELCRKAVLNTRNVNTDTKAKADKSD
jgi:hypothetical protein